MAKKERLYTIGDWVVHRSYGIGQICSIEVKPLRGEKVECCKVETKDSKFWFPANQVENPRIRLVTSRTGVQRALKVLGKLPRDEDVQDEEIKQRIEEVKPDGSLVSIAGLVRDLHARSLFKNLNASESRALEALKEQILSEWSLVIGKDVQTLRPQFRAILEGG